MSAGTVSIPGSNVHWIVASLEYTRPTIVDVGLVFFILKAIDKFIHWNFEIVDSMVQDDENSFIQYNEHKCFLYQ